MPDRRTVSRLELTRREIAGGLAVLAGMAAMAPALAPLPAGAASMPPLRRFLSATANLTGVAVESIDEAVARPLWWQAVQLAANAGFSTDSLLQVVELADQSGGDDAKLAAALTTHTLWPQAKILQQLWYTGLAIPALASPSEADEAITGETAVLFYDQALAWAACSFTKPAATCGGETDYWYEAPQAGGTGK